MVAVHRPQTTAAMVLRCVGRGVQANDCAKHACERVGESRQGAKGGVRIIGIGVCLWRNDFVVSAAGGCSRAGVGGSITGGLADGSPCSGLGIMRASV